MTYLCGSVAVAARLTGFVSRGDELKMNKAIVMVVLLLAVWITTGVSAYRRDILASFDGGVGVIPVQNVAGAMNPDGTFPEVRRNVVRGVNPGGGPWRIADLRAVVDSYGRIKVRGRGLLLASGNSIGQTANQSVFATLICEATAPFVERSTSTGGVRLQPNGDFLIDDTLDPAPSECPSPVLLIRTTAAGGAWFAAGIPDLGRDD
jgi:hypothetical protein